MEIIIEKSPDIPKTQVAKSSEDEPGKPENAEEKKERTFWGAVRIVEAENKEDDNKINNVVEHDFPCPVINLEKTREEYKAFFRGS